MKVKEYKEQKSVLWHVPSLFNEFILQMQFWVLPQVSRSRPGIIPDYAVRLLLSLINSELVQSVISTVEGIRFSPWKAPFLNQWTSLFPHRILAIWSQYRWSLLFDVPFVWLIWSVRVWSVHLRIDWILHDVIAYFAIAIVVVVLFFLS